MYFLCVLSLNERNPRPLLCLHMLFSLFSNPLPNKKYYGGESNYTQLKEKYSNKVNRLPRYWIKVNDFCNWFVNILDFTAECSQVRMLQQIWKKALTPGGLILSLSMYIAGFSRSTSTSLSSFLCQRPSKAFWTTNMFKCCRAFIWDLDQ